jgi:hypothetical protein
MGIFKWLANRPALGEGLLVPGPPDQLLTQRRASFQHRST